MFSIDVKKKEFEVTLLVFVVAFASLAFPFAMSLANSVLIGNQGQIRTGEVMAASGYWGDIQAAVNVVVAHGGVGIVRIPTGRYAFIKSSETWPTGYNGKVNVPAGVNIIGATTSRGTVGGIDDFVIADPSNATDVKYHGWKTILYIPIDVGVTGGANPGFFFDVTGARSSFGAKTPTTRISDIFFEGYRFEHNTSTLEVGPIMMDGVTDFRIDHCDFRSLGWGMHIGNPNRGYPNTACGVIDHCNIINDVGYAGWGMEESDVQYGIVCYGTGWGSSPSEHYWISNPLDILGKYTPLSVYIEDCQFSLWRHDIAANDDAHYVVRHCIFDNDAGYSTLDAHGARGSTGRDGTRAVEVYDCAFGNVGGDHYLTQLFAAAVAFHDNKVSSSYQILYLGNDGSPYFDYAYLWNNRKTDASGADIGPMTIQPDVLGGVGSLIFLNIQLQNYTEYTYPHPLTLEQ